MREARSNRLTIRKKGNSGVAGRALVAFLAALSVLLLSSIAEPAQAALSRSGPVDPDTGFPAWLEDSEGLRLEPCFTPANCSVPVPDAGTRPSTPYNIGDRAVYWSATATVPTNNGGSAVLAVSTRGEFSPSREPTAGTQHVFNRIRIRVDNLVPGATYEVTHPYGTETFTDVDGGSRGIDFTEDVGCLQAPCGDFMTAVNGRVDPWLTWDTLGAAVGAPPAGYIGDASTPHKVTGTPVTGEDGYEQNYFQINGPDVGGPGVDVVRTDLFVVEGKIARLTAFANPEGGLYGGEQSVTLTASDVAAKIFYTTDGTSPTSESTPYDGPIPVTSTTTLKFVALGADGRERSPVVTETYALEEQMSD